MTSVDWISYPILDITETPGEVDVVLINHPELPPTGAGEPSIRPVAASKCHRRFSRAPTRLSNRGLFAAAQHSRHAEKRVKIRAKFKLVNRWAVMRILICKSSRAPYNAE